MREGPLAWVARHNVLITAALGPLFLIPGLYTMPALLVALLLQIIAARRSEPARISSYILLATVVLIAGLGVGLWASPARDLSWPVFFRIAWGLALCWAIAHGLTGRRSQRAFALALVLLTAAAATLAVVGTGWFAGKLFDLPFYNYLPTLISRDPAGIVGAFHPNVIAATLGPLMLFVSALSLETTLAWPWKVALWLLVVALAGVLLLTQSRGGWVAVSAGFLALSFIWLKNSRARWGLVAAGAGLGGALLWSRTWLGGGQTASLAGRFELWGRSLLMLRDMPFTGIGLAAFPVVMDAFYPSFIAGPNAGVPHAHNLYLQAGLDLGIFGMAAFIALFAGALALAWRGTGRAPRCSFEWCFAVAATTGLIVIGVHGLVDAGLWAARSAPLIWVFIGLGLSIGSGQGATHPERMAC